MGLFSFSDFKYFNCFFKSIIIVLGAIGYFAFTKTDEKDSNNGHDQNENNGNHNDTITVETTTLSGISKWENNEEIQIFREYLRIRTVHPNPIDYSKFFFARKRLKEYSEHFLYRTSGGFLATPSCEP